METKFTKGPWAVKTHESKFMPGQIIQDGVCGPDGEQIRVDGVTLTSSEEAKANAHLIAAAPDLLEAVETLLDCFVNDPLGWMDSSDIAIEKAYDAIHKAKGE